MLFKKFGIETYCSIIVTTLNAAGATASSSSKMARVPRFLQDEQRNKEEIKRLSYIDMQKTGGERSILLELGPSISRCCHPELVEGFCFFCVKAKEVKT